MRLAEKAFIGWVGLRGAVPIILATYPVLAGLKPVGLIIVVVFFEVLSSVLIQGTTLPWVARWLRVEESPPTPLQTSYQANQARED